MTTTRDRFASVVLATVAIGVVALLLASLRGWDPAVAAAAPDVVRDAEVAVAGEVGPAQPATFTIGELAAGEVTRARFDAFWGATVARIAAGPCPPPATAGAGSTVVVFAVGATPPADLLAAGWTDWAPRLDATRAAQAAECADGR